MADSFKARRAAESRLDLLRISHNSKLAPASFTLDFRLFDIGLVDAEFVGAALSLTTSVSWLRICFANGNDGEIPVDKLQELAYYLRNNAYLKVVEFGFPGPFDVDEPLEGYPVTFVHFLCTAAAQNPNIEKISYEPGFNRIREIPETPSMQFTGNLKELKLLSEYCSKAIDGLPSNHTLEWLKVQASPKLWEKLLRKSITVKHLHIYKWIQDLPYYMLSQASHIQTLSLENAVFDENRMNALLDGLTGSATTTLKFHFCRFEEAELGKLEDALRSHSTNVQHLTVKIGQLEFPPERFEGFVGPECGLLSFDLFFKYRQEGLDDVAKKGVRSCSLSSLKFTPQNLASFGPLVKRALTSGPLQSLGMHNGFTSTEDIDLVVELLKDKNCALVQLELNHLCEDVLDVLYGDDEDGEEAVVIKSLAPRIFEGLQGSGAKLQELVLDYDSLEDGILSGIVGALVSSLPSIQSLLKLEINICERRLDSEMEENLLDAVAKNWSLEMCQFVSGYGDLNFGNPLYQKSFTTTYFQNKVQEIMLRNKTARAIKSASIDIVSLNAGQLIQKLESFWELPDGFSLVFLLLDHVPDKFF